ncbi:hypothetical protein FQZ97_763590 [compost metagenome]
MGLGLVAVGVDQHLGAHLGHVAPRETVRERDREHAVLAFERLHALHEAARRFARGVDGDDDVAVDHRDHRLDLAFHGRGADVDQLQPAFEHVGVRVLLEGDHHVGVVHHGGREVVVRVELGADHHIRAHDLAHARQHVAFAVVVAVGHHRAVQAEQHHVHRQRGAQVVQHFVAQGFVGVARGDAAGLRARHHAFEQRPALFLAADARGPQRARVDRQRIGMLAGGKVAAVLEGRDAGRHRAEGVGFGREGGTEDTHGDFSWGRLVGEGTRISRPCAGAAGRASRP